MKPIVTRTVFGALYVGVIVAGVLCGSFSLLVLLLLLSTLAINEFLTLANMDDTETSPVVKMLLSSLDCIGGAIMVITFWAGMIWSSGIASYLLYLCLRMCVQLWMRQGNSLHALSSSFMSQLYVALPISLMTVIYRISPNVLLLLFVLVWVNDTFAFLTGSLFGRHKLWVRISPKKSWEGLIGGVVFTVGIAALCGYLFRPQLAGFGADAMAIVGVIVAVSATFGDLIESMIKRTVGVKDSGNLIPGHGGILDRIDSLLLVMPAITIFIYYVLSYAI
jgi:phosphatidate cytidylyltransferase